MNQICFRTCSEEKTPNKNWSSGQLTAQSGSGGAARSCQSSSQKNWQTDFDRSQSCAEELVALELGNRSTSPSTLRQHVRTKLVASLCCVEVRTLFSTVRPLWWTTIIQGYLANVRVGRHCVVKSRSVIRPPFKKFSKGYVVWSFVPVSGKTLLLLVKYMCWVMGEGAGLYFCLELSENTS